MKKVTSCSGNSKNVDNKTATRKRKRIADENKKKTREQREAASLQREKDYKVQMIQEDHVLHAAGNTQIQMIPDWLTNGSNANSAINGTIKRVLRRMACLMIYSFTASHVVRQFFFIFHEPEL